MKPSAIDLAALRRVVLSEGMDLDALQASPGYLPLAAAYLARAVPALEWRMFGNGEEAETKALLCEAWLFPGGDQHTWTISTHDGVVVESGNGKGMDAAKSNCEAAFLRLVGVQP